jgi:hypothetical protein
MQRLSMIGSLLKSDTVMITSWKTAGNVPTIFGTWSARFSPHQMCGSEFVDLDWGPLTFILELAVWVGGR